MFFEKIACAITAFFLTTSIVPAANQGNKPEPVDPEILRGQVLTILQREGIASASICYKDSLQEICLSVVNTDFYAEKGMPEEAAAINEHSVYQAASISKITFNHIFWKMREEGYFNDLDQPIYEVWPGMLDLFNDDQKDLAKQITFRMALTHTTGLDRTMTKGPFVFKRIDKGFYPGADKFAYSNAAISILGWAMEYLKGYEPGTGLTKISREYIFDPLGMDETSFEWIDKYNSIAVHGFTNTDRKTWNNNWKGGKSNAAYSLRTNAKDYTKYLQWVMHGANLSPETMKLMLEPLFPCTSAKVECRRTLGWFCEENELYGNIYRHNGSLPGFRGLACFIPKLDASFCVFVNTNTDYDVLQEIRALFL